jgi:hypothetical protein
MTGIALRLGDVIAGSDLRERSAGECPLIRLNLAVVANRPAHRSVPAVLPRRHRLRIAPETAPPSWRFAPLARVRARGDQGLPHASKAGILEHDAGMPRLPGGSHPARAWAGPAILGVSEKESMTRARVPVHKLGLQAVKPMMPAQARTTRGRPRVWMGVAWLTGAWRNVHDVQYELTVNDHIRPLLREFPIGCMNPTIKMVRENRSSQRRAILAVGSIQ